LAPQHANHERQKNVIGFAMKCNSRKGLRKMKVNVRSVR